MFISLLLVIFLFAPMVTPVEIHCKFSTFDYFTVGRVYTCAVEQKRDALHADSEVIKVAGDHSDKKKDRDVLAVRVHSRMMHTFPSHFERFFTDLRVIQVYASKLKVITQKDLKPFTNLQHIDLSSNDLESLERELFKFNVELLVIKISENKLKFIDASAFDSLFKLHTLDLNDNQCIWRSTGPRESSDEEEEITREDVIDVMYEARNRCYRDLILKELHDMEMGKFLKERSEVVVSLETKIAELQAENENFYNKMREYKDELDVCKMEEIRGGGIKGGTANLTQHETTTSNWLENQGVINHRESFKSGPNSYLPLNQNRELRKEFPRISEELPKTRNSEDLSRTENHHHYHHRQNSHHKPGDETRNQAEDHHKSQFDRKDQVQYKMNVQNNQNQEQLSRRPNNYHNLYFDGRNHEKDFQTRDQQQLRKRPEDHYNMNPNMNQQRMYFENSMDKPIKSNYDTNSNDLIRTSYDKPDDYHQSSRPNSYENHNKPQNSYLEPQNYMLKSQEQNYGQQWDNWGKRSGNERTYNWRY